MSTDGHDVLEGFDTTIHAPNRLRICALLNTAGASTCANERATPNRRT